MGKIMLNGISYGSLTSSPHMIKHGDLSLYQALKFLENKIIIGSGTPNSSMGRNGDLYISYDSAPPELNVGAPAGTSASNPTLLTSTTNVNYQVTGTVNDYGSGVSSVTVNGQPATISGTNWSCTLTLATNTNHTIKVTATDKAGYSTTVTRYLTIYDNTAKNYSYNGGIQTFTAPIDGTYSLTAKGARGGYGKSTTYRGGYGGTATGQIKLTKGTVLYICCGGKGVDATSTGSDKRAGGYNGGGNTYGTSGKYTGSGGGATHIATANGVLSSLSGNKGAILMVAGGGGGGGYESDSFTSTGGHGGGTSGGNGTTTNSSYTTGKGGSQTAGGAGYQGAGSFGQGGHATSDAIGGGGGYYGGGSGQYTCGGGGGSGYLSSSLTSSSMTTGNNNAAGSAIIQLVSVTLPENGGNEPETTVNHFNTALSLVGLGEANSIADVLTNSDSCTALAANSAACSIMKEHYSADMTSMIENNFNEGLNLLNYRCQLTCFLCKGKSLCTNITGGYERAVYHASNASDAPSGNNGSYIYAHATWLGVGSSYLTVNAIDTTGYTKAEAYGRTYGEADSQYVLCGIAHKNSNGNDLTASLIGFPFPAYTSTWSKQTSTSFGTNGYWGVYVRAIGGKDQETGYAEAQYIKLIP